MSDPKRFPGQINVVAVDAAPKVIQSAWVETNDRTKDANVVLTFYPGVDVAEQMGARGAALKAVLMYLGEGWAVS